MDCKKNCSQPDPDIAGIGGMISFAIGAGFTIVLASATLLLNISKSPNAFDGWLFPRVARIIPHRFKINPKTAQSVSKDFLLPILSTSNDTQLLTGFVVLFAGWIHFSRGLSVYHFSVITIMGWLASNSQLLAFFALQLAEHSTPRTRLPSSQASVDDSIAPGGRRNNQRRTPKRSERSRGVLMISHAFLLFAAATLQGHQKWDAEYLRPAQCIAKEWRPGGPPLGWMISNWLMLIWGYWSPVHRLFLKTSSSPPNVRPDDSSEHTVVAGSDASSMSTISKPSRQWIRTSIWCLRMPVDLTITFLDSALLEILIPVAWYIQGLVELVAIRRYGTRSFQECGQDPRKEYEWGFGQIVPTLFLISPILPGLDAFRDYQDLKRARMD